MFKSLTKKVLGFSSAKLPKVQPPHQGKEQRPLSNNYDENVGAIKQVFNLCEDVKFREFKIKAQKPLRVNMIYLEGTTDLAVVSQHVISSLETPQTVINIPAKDSVQALLEQFLTVGDAKVVSDILQLAEAILNGNQALIIEGYNVAILTGAQLQEKRAIEEPAIEPSIRGPRDGFVENVIVNISLVRRRIKSSRMKVESIYIGEITKTKIAILYIEGIAPDKVVDEVKKRLNRIKIDGIIASGYIEELISDEAISVFPLIQTTERPDKTAAALLEGRVALIVDTTPMTLIVPATFITFLQASEDSYNEAVYATFIRLLRFVALNIALLLPALYIAITTYHQELLPSALLMSIAQARVGVPFPAFVEALIMELTFELLREAGVRLPRNVGQAVSTVGGLVIGQAAVQAGIVSSSMVIVVAVTAISSFTIPNIAASFAIRILRFSLMICAAVLGMPGIMLGLMAILVHLCGLRSFGVPYLSPFAPLSPRDLKDTFIRVPWWAMFTRPRMFAPTEPARQNPDLGPRKPGKGGNDS